MAVVERAISSARKLVGEKHILLRDLLEGDLSDWAGSGAVASHALAWPECPGYQAWLTGGEGKDNLPLVAQYWGENGRVIVCQLEVGRRLAMEPVAQLVLRNLLSCAREVPLPARRKAVRFAVPPEALADGKFNTARFVLEPKKEDLKGAAGVIVLLLPKGDESAVIPGFDLDSYMAEGGELVCAVSIRAAIHGGAEPSCPLGLAGQAVSLPCPGSWRHPLRTMRPFRSDTPNRWPGVLRRKTSSRALQGLKILARSKPSRTSRNL